MSNSFKKRDKFSKAEVEGDYARPKLKEFNKVEYKTNPKRRKESPKDLYNFTTDEDDDEEDTEGYYR